VSTDQAIATSALNPLTAGRSVEGRYILSSVLGRGGMAEVWEAFDTVLRRRVAVKLFRGDPASVAEQQRQQAEISLVAALSHPNLVTVFDAGADRSCPGTPCTYLVMELVDGTTLARLLRFGTLPAADVAEVGAELASALAYVHARGIVHRDLKPANVLMSSAPRAAAGAVTAKLTDFGIARILDGARLTLTGTTVGTANYLSPEQASGADVTPASDVYSLGLVLLECITGEVAFPGHGVEAAVARLHRAPAIPQDIEMSWQGLLAAMTARDPATRPTAATVASRLRTLAGRHAGATGSSQLAPRIELAMRQARSVVPGPGASARSAGEGSAHPSLPGNVAGQPAARRRAKPLALAALLAAALTSVVVVLALRGGSSTDGSGTAPPRPYPSVSGKLGTDLRHLRDAVP
jgi:serine/threonine protein kinase